MFFGGEQSLLGVICDVFTRKENGWRASRLIMRARVFIAFRAWLGAMGGITSIVVIVRDDGIRGARESLLGPICDVFARKEYG